MNTYEKLKELRVNHKLNQKELAYELKTSQGVISSCESGSKPAGAWLLERYGSYFGVPIEELYSDSKPKKVESECIVIKKGNNMKLERAVDVLKQISDGRFVVTSERKEALDIIVKYVAITSKHIKDACNATMEVVDSLNGIM